MTTHTVSSPIKRHFNLSFWIAGFALIAGLALSMLSWLEICVQHCSANQQYRLFGFPFAIAGTAFFSTSIIGHFLSLRYTFFSRLIGWMLASAVGAEVMFLIIQKYRIGHLCPVCLSIAVFVAIAALAYAVPYLLTIKTNNPGDTMDKIKKGLTSFSFSVLGFILAFVGVTKPDFAQAAINEIKDRIALGKKGSQVEVFFVTDWFCPSCKKVDPIIEKLYPQIQSKVAFYFVDFPIHRKSLNFTPYNLAFLVNNKSQYFKARHALNELTDETESPTDQEIIKAAKKHNLPFKELSFVDVKAGIEYFDNIATKYDLNSTPTIIITNTKTNKTEKLQGSDEIDEESVLKAIESISKSK